MSPAHPHLFFDAGDVEALRERCRNGMRPQFERLLAFVEEHLGDDPPELTGDYETRGDILQNPYLVNIVAFAFTALITGDARHREAARRWTIALASMDHWVGLLDVPRGACANCGYPEGWGALALAVSYDWLYPYYLTAERALLRDKIALFAKVLHDATYAGEWWTHAYLHHDTWIPVGGLGVAAMAILDEVPRAAIWADRAIHELSVALDWLDSDGAWPEGPCGWAFAMFAAIPLWDAYARRFPARGRAIFAHPWIAETWKFRLYSRTPDGQFLGFGDCHPHGGYQSTAYEAAPTLRFLAARYRNPYAQWLAAREWESRPNPCTAAWEILWADPSVPEAPPTDLPRGALFSNQGMAFLRTGWDERSTVLAFRGAALLGRRATALFRGQDEEAFNNSTTHAHADANSFGIWSRGAIAMTMSRYGQRETRYQNSLLVNGAGQTSTFGKQHIGRPDGEVVDFFTSEDASLVAADAAHAYPPGLQRFLRKMYLVRPGVVFLVDDVAASGPVTLEWRLHVDASASIDLGEDGFTSVDGGLRTLVRVASPEGVRFALGSDKWNRAVRLIADQPRTHGALAAAIVPSLAPDAHATIEALSDRAFSIHALDSSILAAFGAEIPGRIASDGTAAIVVRDADGTLFLAADATRLDVAGARVFTATSRVTLAHRRRPGSDRLTVVASAPATLTLASASGHPLTISVPQGRSEHTLP
jgi:hypothetical protein